MNQRVEPSGLATSKHATECEFIDEVWRAICDYAKANNIKPRVAVAEACRAYFLGDLAK